MGQAWSRPPENLNRPASPSLLPSILFSLLPSPPPAYSSYRFYPSISIKEGAALQVLGKFRAKSDAIVVCQQVGREGGREGGNETRDVTRGSCWRERKEGEREKKHLWARFLHWTSELDLSLLIPPSSSQRLSYPPSIPPPFPPSLPPALPIRC